MFQLLIAGEVNSTHYLSEQHALDHAPALVAAYLASVPALARVLKFFPDGMPTAEYAAKYSEVQEMLSVWIETDGGEYYPQRDYGFDGEDKLLFKLKDGTILFGGFDHTRCVFLDADDAETTVDEVVAWFVPAECPF